MLGDSYFLALNPVHLSPKGPSYPREWVPGIACLSQGLSETRDLDTLESEQRLFFWRHWVSAVECKLFVATLWGFSPVVAHTLLLL